MGELKRCFVEARRQRAEELYLKPIGLDFDQFAQMQGRLPESCRRTVASVIYRETLTKAHCGWPVELENQSRILESDLFHATCLQRLMTDTTIRLSRALNRRSRELIEQSRRRTREGHGWPPPDSAA